MLTVTKTPAKFDEILVARAMLEKLRRNVIQNNADNSPSSIL